MKRCILFLVLCSAFPALSHRAEAQPPDALIARIHQVTALFRTAPGGYDTIFDADFLNQIPAAQLTAIFTQYVSNYGNVTRWHYIDISKPWSAKLRIETSKGFAVDLSLAATEGGKHLLHGLLLSAATPQTRTLPDVVDTLKGFPGMTAFLAATLSSSGIESIAALHPDSALALGSTFKLYVLARLLKEINEGKRHWNDVIYLDSNSRAFPSGQMHTWPNNSPVTLATAATLMISISDNTAADLLLHTLGRENVESMVRESGNTHAERDVPFLTVLETWKLKSNDMRLGKEYLHRSTDARRQFLDREVARFPRDSITLGGGVSAIDRLEWFASPRDIAALFRYILDNSQSGEGRAVRDILAVNPGLSEKTRWQYIGYKGGSEPGVLNMSYLLESKSGTWYVLTGSWNDPNHSLKDDDFEGIMQRAAELLP
jgi:hypothetical protein